MKILLTEDDEATIESIELCLKAFSPELTIIPALSGAEALSNLMNDVYDVMLLDLGLPDMDGIELLGRIRKFSDIPVIVVTARHNPESEANARRLGIYEYVSKPFDFKKLIQLIQQSTLNQ
jgi:two-component system KDP operon response regulator KdpE